MEYIRIDQLTHRQAESHFKKRPAVIVPLGGCEPFGEAGALGAGTVCAGEIAGELSRRCGVLAAPAIPFGCSVPFTAFAGAAGVKPRTFVNMMCDILRAYALQGATRLFLVSAAPFNREPAAEVVKRVEGKYPGVRVVFFDINTALDGVDGNKFDRDDALLLSILAYIRPSQARVQMRRNWTDKYRTWKKRGKDPQKLRALFSDGLLSSSDIDINPDRGKEYFDRIVNALQSEIERLIY